MHSTSPKHELRKLARSRRAAISPKQRLDAALALIRHARSGRMLRPGRKIAAYVPHGSEFPVWPLVLKALQAGCRIYLPVVPASGRRLAFCRFDQHTVWRSGAYGIPEPHHPETCAARDLDLVLVPLLAFDAQLYRMGQGGGYYDTTFAFRRQRRHWRKPRLVGVGFECQRFEHLPTDHWDMRLDAILTEAGWQYPDSLIRP